MFCPFLMNPAVPSNRRALTISNVEASSGSSPLRIPVEAAGLGKASLSRIGVVPEGSKIIT